MLVIAQTVSRRSVTAVAWVQSQDIQHGTQ